ncbi:glycosyltransferase family 4 protein [Vibrio metschnikovii]|nr:glycosyltransferase family 4 protein [Vibrio metschnikovii]
MKKLLVVCEVFISDDGKSTVSRSFNAILNEYKKHFDRVDVIGPSKNNTTIDDVKNVNGIYYWGTNLYSKKIKDRFKYLLFSRRSRLFFKSVFNESQPDLIQFRVPSIFSFVAFDILKNSEARLTSYISGEWYSSFISNYNFIGNKIVAKILDYKQLTIIKNTVCVSAGPQVAEIYKKHNSIFPYFSTTHTRINRCHKPDDCLNLIFLGRLEGLKRVEDAIKSISILIDKYNFSRIKLNIYGDGKDRKRLENLVFDLGLESNVIFHGYVNEVDVLEKAYINSHFLVFPSISEGTPKVLAEAMSFGVIPVAVKTTGSIRFIIDHLNNGILVDAYSPEAIAREIKHLSDNIEEMNTIRNNCYSYAELHTLSNEVTRLWEYVFCQHGELIK